MEENLKNTDIEQPPRRYTLQEYQQMVENGRRQVKNGECYTTEEVMAMCMEDDLVLEAV
ncbi:MAG: hypothetical protein IKM98_05105 [Bacteroidales bacterium]|jgi:hypothetical protein|nr:hypothetical protein [Bacteroidales bacterium]